MAGGVGGSVDSPPAHISSAAARGSMGGRGLPRSLGRIGGEEDGGAAAAATAQSVGDRSAQGGWGVWDAIGDEKEGSGDWGEEGRASRGDCGVG